MLTLSGGDEGGVEVSAEGWELGLTREINGSLYRRTSDTQAVFVGIV